MRALSGGERRRLGLAVLVASGANFLVLDEPTNHLDLASRETLEAALEAFPGTVLLVSHDRALLDAVAEQTAAIEDGTVRLHSGGWADYVARRDERAAPARRPKQPAAGKPPPPPKPKTGPTPLEEIESRIASKEAEIAALEARLAEDWSDLDTVDAHRRARDELQRLLGRWETLFDEVAT